MSLFRPRLILSHVTEVTPALLAAHGLRGVLLDLDNTLVEHGSYSDAHDVQAWAMDLSLAGVQLYLLSNATRGRVQFWTGKLGFAGKGLASKPIPRNFRKAARRMGLPPQRVAMVGDQLFTDVLGGNLAGMFTVMVRPLADNALLHTRLARGVEKFVLEQLGEMHPRDFVPPARSASALSRSSYPRR